MNDPYQPPEEGEVAEALALMEAAVDAIITIDDSGRVRSFNPAAERMFGRDAKDVIGRPINALMPDPHSTRHDDYLARYLNHGDPRIIGIGRDVDALNADGDLVPIHLAVSEYWLGGERRFLGVLRDLTSQRQAEEAERETRARLAHAGRVSLMGEMTAGIAHEINQPLAAITMYSQACINLLASDNADLERLSGALEKLRDQALRAGAVIERLQRFVKGRSVVAEPTDMNELMTDVVALAANDGRLENIELKTSFSSPLPTVRCDSVQIQQVALNLIRNAIDAMAEIGCENGRDIEISTQLGDRQVTVTVADAGPGVTDEDEVFRPFHTTKLTGMGMGLSISKTIIDAHGGELSFKNLTPFGAAFSFRLPAEKST